MRIRNFFFFALLLAFTPPSVVAFPPDFDGDGKADPTVYRPTDATWYFKTSSRLCTSQMTPVVAGDPSKGCKLLWGAVCIPPMTQAQCAYPLSGDFDGDGYADPTVIAGLTTTPLWAIRYATYGWSSYIQYGLAGDRPDETDVTGDGISDLMVLRLNTANPATGNWFVRSSTLPNPTTIYGAGTNFFPPQPQTKAVSANYTTINAPYGDPTNYSEYVDTSILYKRWTWVTTANAASSSFLAGLGSFSNNQKTVLASIAGGLFDFVWWEPSTAVWSGYYSNGFTNGGGVITFTPPAASWGLPNDIPLSADYDGDGKGDRMIFRPSEGNWYLLNTLSPTCPSGMNPIVGGGCALQWGLPCLPPLTQGQCDIPIG